VAVQYPQVFQRLKKSYEDWFADVSSSRPDNYAPPRIVIGTKHEPRSVLTRQDRRRGNSNGFWLLEAPEPAAYEVEVIFKEEYPTGQATITAGKARQQLDLAANKKRGHTTMMLMPAGKFKLSVDAVFNGKTQGPHQVILTVK
jgi:arylsulfatase/arylsulfatase A